MYPYNRNTHYFQRQSLTAREAKDPAIQELAEDDRLLALLKVATEETAQLANRYRRLLTEAPALSSSADMLKSMYLDEKKHLKNLREALFLITGETPETPDESQTPSTLEVIDPKAWRKPSCRNWTRQISTGISFWQCPTAPFVTCFSRFSQISRATPTH